MKVAIVGAGDMGRWLASFSKNLGQVTVSDIDAKKAQKVAAELGIISMAENEAVKEADLVLVAVPISKTPEVIKSLSKIAKKGSLLADVASVKAEVVDAMRTVKAEIELVSLHPLFGPGAKNIKGKDVIAVPVRPGKRYIELKKILARSGALVAEMDADTHDRLMAIVQCLTQFMLIAYLRAVKSVKDMKMATKLRTPMFATLTNLAKAILEGNPKVYGELQVRNKYAKIVRSSMTEACSSLDKAFSGGDAKAAEKVFEEALVQFGKGEAKKAYLKLYEQFEGEM